MVHEAKGAGFVRGLVKTVFILCYVAFMWASIHHVATFFNNFEQDNGNMFGSYLLAGAFDITALVSTIGVMFFRKSMPGHIQFILWIFILALAGYSFIINWEYAQHYQSAELIMQPTGQTIAVYDKQNVLHYVPEMKTNNNLLLINPILASGFTIFALIYSVVAEFFGTKAPTIEELQAKKQYLEETSTVVESIKQLEEKTKGKSLIAKVKDTSMATIAAVNDVRKFAEQKEESTQETERNTDELEFINLPETTLETIQNVETIVVGNVENVERKRREKKQESIQKIDMENMPEWLATSGSTIHLDEVVKHTNINRKKLNHRVENKTIRATKNKDIVMKASLIAWMKSEGILQETDKMPAIIEIGNEEETVRQLENTTEENVPEMELIEA